jgi:CBS domain-containing protein
MKLRDIMTTPVLTFGRYEPASDALADMLDAGVRHAVVLAGDEVIGVLSDRDLGGRHGGAMRVGRSVGELMREEPFVVPPDMTVNEAVQMIRAMHIGCLPIVDDGRLIGIVTRGDLLGALASKRRAHGRTRSGALRA